MKEITRLEKIVNGLNAKIEMLKSYQPSVKFNSENETITFDGLEVVKRNGKSIILRDNIGREFMFRCTEHIDGITKGTRLPIVDAIGS